MAGLVDEVKRMKKKKQKQQAAMAAAEAEQHGASRWMAAAAWPLSRC